MMRPMPSFANLPRAPMGVEPLLAGLKVPMPGAPASTGQNILGALGGGGAGTMGPLALLSMMKGAPGASEFAGIGAAGDSAMGQKMDDYAPQSQGILNALTNWFGKQF